MIDVSAWPGLRLVEQMVEGNRNEVWRGDLGGTPVAVRKSRRTPSSLAWELGLIARLDSLDFLVPTVIGTPDGSSTVNGVVVQHWIDGRPPASEQDWQGVAAELQRLHTVVDGHPQRPGCCTCLELVDRRQSVDADLDAMPAAAAQLVTNIFARHHDVPVTVIHGDPDPSNLRIASDGRVGLLDWDESRVDASWHDLSNLGVQVLSNDDHAAALRLSNAWEAANAWTHEPAYAQRRFANITAD